MNRAFRYLACCAAAWALSCAASAAQASDITFKTQVHDVVYTVNGQEYTGTILEQTNEKIRFRIYGKSTVLELEKSKIRRIVERTTPESAVKNALEEAKANPRSLAETARAALEHFKGNRSVEGLVLKTLEAQAAGKDPVLLLLLADLYVVAERFGDAERTAKDVIARANSAQAQRLLGEALAAQPGRAKEAEAALRAALKLAPEDEDVLVSIGNFLRAEGRGKEAGAVFEDALKKNPNLVAALAGQGYVRLRQGEVAEAALSFQQALQSDAKHLRAKLGLAACHVMRREYDQAYKLCLDVLEYDARNAAAYGIQGYAKLFAGDTDEALKKIEESLKEQPGNPRMMLIKAVALQRAAQALNAAGKSSEANEKMGEGVKLLDDIVAMDPPDAYLQFLLAGTRYRSDNLEQALQRYTRTTVLAPAYAPAFQNMGAAALGLRKWEEAEKAYQAAIQLAGAQPQADYYAGLGLAKLGMRQLDEAQKYFKLAKDKDPKNVAALCGLGYIQNFRRDERSAMSFFMQALAADGNCAYAATALSQMFAFRNQKFIYHDFSNNSEPENWSAKGGRTIRAHVEDGRLVFDGTSGSAVAGPAQYYTSVPGGAFVRVEADLGIAKTAAAEYGLRIATASSTAVQFELEFGKDESGNLAYRYRDYRGMAPVWRTIAPWPDSGRVRLAIETEDLPSGKFQLLLDGTVVKDVDLQMKNPKNVTAGLFLKPGAKQKVDAWTDNLALLLRVAEGDAGEGGEDEAKEAAGTRH